MIALIIVIKQRLKTIRQLTLVNYLKLRAINNGLGHFFPYQGTKINIDKTAIIEIKKGAFSFNAKWDKNEPFYSVFSMRENSRFIVQDSFTIHSNTRLSINKNATLELGSGYINNNLNLACGNHIKIGHNVAISENVVIRDSDNHQITSSDRDISEPIEIGNNVWIGMNVIILKGVTIGDGSIIGAGTVLTKSVPNNSLVVGVPGRVIKSAVHWK